MNADRETTQQFATVGDVKSRQPTEHAAAPDIAVREFDLTLLWPLLIEDALHSKGGPTTDGHGILTSWVEWIENQAEKNGWKERPRKYPQQEPPDCYAEYAEFVYFHPFVREFLYTSRGDLQAYGDATPGKPQDAPNRRMRIMERRDAKRLVVEYFHGGQTHSVPLRIRQVQLYLFDTQTAIFVLKLDNEGSPALNLPQVQILQDVVRQAYAPYWEVGEAPKFAGHCPERVTLEMENPAKNVVCSYGGSSDLGSKAVTAHLENVLEHREPYTIETLQQLLQPLVPVGIRACSGKESLRYEQIEDHRIPIMSYFAVDDPRRISDGDWQRLALVDDPGRSDCSPYSPDFLRGDFQRFCYDRFWSPTGAPPAQDWHNTRWLCSGYAFVGVGDARSDFFTDKVSGGRAHFRHHYFKLGLIAHFHRASLLSFEQRTAEAVESLQHEDELDQRGREEYERTMSQIHRDLVRFRSKYWFTEVSNQPQGIELFDLWSRHLGTVEMFDEVFREVDDATEIVHRWNEKRQSDSQSRLTIVAALFLILSPVLGIVVDNVSSLGGKLLIGIFLPALFILLALICAKWLGQVISALGGPPQGLRQRLARIWQDFVGANKGKHFKWIVVALLAVLGFTGYLLLREPGSSARRAPVPQSGNLHIAPTESEPEPAEGADPKPKVKPAAPASKQSPSKPGKFKEDNPAGPEPEPSPPPKPAVSKEPAPDGEPKEAQQRLKR